MGFVRFQEEKRFSFSPSSINQLILVMDTQCFLLCRNSIFIYYSQELWLQRVKMRFNDVQSSAEFRILLLRHDATTGADHLFAGMHGTQCTNHSCRKYRHITVTATVLVVKWLRSRRFLCMTCNVNIPVLEGSGLWPEDRSHKVSCIDAASSFRSVRQSASAADNPSRGPATSVGLGIVSCPR
jgi:hypothetical protein